VIFLFFLWVAYEVIQKMDLAEGEDPLEIVIDEFLGILLAFWMVPMNWKSLLVGFLLFRFFDVTKIFPLNLLEKRKGAHGIILDDLGAGAYTWLILKILFR
jgi:phosphatidylglycerophosphatase A